MRRLALLVAGALVSVLCAVATAQSPDDARRPSIGYAYPAGGCEGSIVQVRVGGQNLRGTREVLVSGEGVTAQVVRWVRPLGFQQQRELRRRINAVRAERRAATSPDRRRKRGNKKPEAKPEEPEVRLPPHPLLENLDTRTDRELDEIAFRFIDDRSKKQINRQLAEVVEIELEVAPGTPPGWRELRLVTPAGVTNAVRVRVDALPEVNESEPLGKPEFATPVADVPVLFNGQILPGDVDTFRFRARAGARLQVTTAARDLVPFLADAVPGWFQAVVTIRDEAGHELAYADDFGFEPDPRLVFDVPSDATYEIEIRDAIYRGREDFVYRIAISEDPGRAWTPSRDAVPPDVLPSALTGYDVIPESEPNGSVDDAQGLLGACVVRGRIERPSDVDAFVVQGRAGDRLVAEIEARRSGSPLDAVIHVLGPDGAVIGWNDDHDDGAPGLWTHAADPYVLVELPADGAYVVRVSDTSEAGGAAFDYRLRVGPPRPDVHVIVTPSTLRVAPGAAVPVGVHAVRRDGYDGPVDLHLVDAPEGFVLQGGGVPAGATSVRLTLTAPLYPPRDLMRTPVPLAFVGRTVIDGREVVHEALPADVRMQAFAYHHLAPAEQVLALVAGARRSGVAELVTDGPVRVVPGRKTSVDFRVPGLRDTTLLAPELDAPPEGLELAGWEVSDGHLRVFLKCAAEHPVPETNLIVQGWTTVKNGKGGTRRVFAGYLPAVRIVGTAPSPD